MKITYNQLAEQILKMTPEQRACNVTIYLTQEDEYIPAEQLTFVEDEDDVLDADHPIITVNG